MTSAHQNLGWLVSDFVRSTDGVTHAIAVSSDGLLIAVSDGLTRDLADHLAAVVSGITSLAQNAAQTHGFHGMKLVMIEMLDGFMMVTHMRDGSCLGVLAEEGCDIGLIGYEMAVLADRAGALLTPQLVGQLRQGPLTR
ncbi:roadblock/LC7 domain-containing protein [Streptomyces viridochromogenes]|uniref:Putative Roadblock/LC7 family protein n=1 Tax=Streptomyces viridochromogenes Tue57 TaxID=1160705 RepID=L8P6S3_STRVR|nr:roadblock/LC7 domain-containing protein [Streptomyces viridochromogenes]ELS51002.1 putative Roadblock/LC7 family protein [Streptomyces viridochromogenes Tue57]